MAGKLDLSKFKKVSGDKHQTVMQHADGHQLTVIHKALSPAMRSQFISLTATEKQEKKAEELKKPGVNVPKAHEGSKEAKPVMMAKGDDAKKEDAMPVAAALKVIQDAVKAPEDTTKISTSLPAVPPEALANPNPGSQVKPPEVRTLSPEQQASSGASYTEALPAPPANLMPGMSAEPSGGDINPPEPERAPAGAAPATADATPPQPPADPMGTEAYSQNYMQGLGTAVEGITNEAAAAQQIGQETAKALQESAKQQQEIQKRFQSNQQEIMKETEGAIEDLRKQHITTNHLFASMNDGKGMGTGQKITTAIGLILGGIAGGMLHQENPADKFLNQMIDRDIEAQKAEMGKKENLVGAYFKKFGNMRDATDMARLIQLGWVDTQLKIAAANAQGPQAASRAQQSIGQLQMQAAPIMSNLAMRRTMQQSTASSNADPATKIRMLKMAGYMSEGDSHLAYKELQEAQNAYKSRDNVMGAFDALVKLNTVGNRVGSPLQTARQVAAKRDALTAELAKATAGRFTAQDSEMLAKNWPQPGDTEETASIKRAALDALISDKLHYPILDAHGIQPQSAARFSPAGGQKRIQLGAPVRKE